MRTFEFGQKNRCRLPAREFNTVHGIFVLRQPGFSNHGITAMAGASIDTGEGVPLLPAQGAQKKYPISLVVIHRQAGIQPLLSQFSGFPLSSLGQPVREGYVLGPTAQMDDQLIGTLSFEVLEDLEPVDHLDYITPGGMFSYDGLNGEESGLGYNG